MRIYNSDSIISHKTLKKRGCGFVNKLINKLPIELHIPGYKFCGPGTKLQKRLKRGDIGINKLDEACKQHDIAYSQHPDLESRHKADNLLAAEAINRIHASDAGLGEKTAALGIAAAMKAKTKLGMGLKRKRVKTVGFNTLVRKARTALMKKKPTDLTNASKIALNAVKKLKTKKPTRIIPVPKQGGFLPLIPLFAGLSALGALGGGAAGIAKAVNDAKAATADLQEKQRHNKAIEAIALGKGLYIKPHKKGYGLYLWPPKNSQ